MKVYVVLIDYKSGQDTKVYGVYKQYRHARQDALRVLDIDKDTGMFRHNNIRVRVVAQEVTE